MVDVRAGLDEGDRPVVDVAIEEVDLLAALRPDEIVRDGFVVVQKVILDDVALVAQAKNEILVPESGRSTSSGARESAACRSAPWAWERHRRIPGAACRLRRRRERLSSIDLR